VYDVSPAHLPPSWCAKEEPPKNIVFLSKRVARNSRMMEAVSSGMSQGLVSKRGLPQNIVLLSKRRYGNIVLLGKEYCAPG
jgi:hypothetical protein